MMRAFLRLTLTLTLIPLAGHLMRLLAEPAHNQAGGPEPSSDAEEDGGEE